MVFNVAVWNLTYNVVSFYRADDFLVIHAPDDLVNVQGTTPYTHSNPGTPINMPWLGSTQTGRGASVVSRLSKVSLVYSICFSPFVCSALLVIFYNQCVSKCSFSV